MANRRERTMRIQWWQSIRWRFALASALIALIATSLLALVAILMISHYYGEDQRGRLGAVVGGIADDKAHGIVKRFQDDPRHNLELAVNQELDGWLTQQDQQPLVIVFRPNGVPIYPFRAETNPLATQVPTHATATADALSIEQATAIARATATALPTDPNKRIAPDVQETATAKRLSNARSTLDKVVAYSLGLQNRTLEAKDLALLEQAIERAWGRKHQSTDGEFGRNNPIDNVQPFSVRPLMDDKRLLGVIVVTNREQKLPPFIFSVGEAVLLASLAVAMLAALAAILFSQTITNPLSRLTQATRVLAQGNYDAQVTMKAPGELGELADNFNHMATQLKQDVEELRRQEVWRRELIMNITHDLATPLTAIAGLGESLMDGVNQSREDYEITGRIIMNETLRLRRLVQDLHMMAKVEGGALQPKPKPVRLAALIDEVLAVQIAEFERHQIEPSNLVPFQLPLVLADPDMLTRVFANLFSNALRHTQEGGGLTISAIAEPQRVIISCTDTGEGIPEDALDRIFERFYRVDGARQSSTGGSGLGLAIVRAIIEAHGGTIWASNAPGGGASISFSLPLPAAPDNEVTQPMVRLPASARKKAR
ncbi:sensor histidine kinase [Tengunoibacter tsumagoiensis]|uniref:histidine kinase n=1 Tax=Tengunoibacter tsumagoiensis TaxID=2014871 RepID=A0A401ZX23_9CHLR|nr:ATP-binding protein [Tengunoibacter tsumagoiensis]GCE11294.1 hypothetical protein KTT_11530 [Tengunoibacter tsumagoiensis]